jgi:hypothetical protein
MSAVTNKSDGESIVPKRKQLALKDIQKANAKRHKEDAEEADEKASDTTSVHYGKQCVFNVHIAP